MSGDVILELVGIVFAILYLILEYKASFLLWSVGIVMSIFYIIIFYHAKFYADAGIYFYYLFANVYGLFVWKKNRQRNVDRQVKDNLPITRLNKKYYSILILTFVASFAFLNFILIRFTDSPVPVGDALTTSLSVVAMWLLAKKNIEHWLLWIVINFISAGLYCYKALYPTAILFVVYGIVSIFAYYNWKKQLENSQSSNPV